VSVENNAIVIRPHRYANDDNARTAGAESFGSVDVCWKDSRSRRDNRRE
jgi:hypothetical protein